MRGGERVKRELRERRSVAARKSTTLCRQENGLLVDNGRVEAISRLVNLPIISREQQLPRNAKKIFSDVPLKAKKQPHVNGSKTVNSQDFNLHSNSLKRKQRDSPAVCSNANVLKRSPTWNPRLQPRWSSLREPNPSPRLLARNPSFQRRSYPGSLQSRLDLKPDWRSRSPSKGLEPVSSETGTTIPTGWRCLQSWACPRFLCLRQKSC